MSDSEAVKRAFQLIGEVDKYNQDNQLASYAGAPVPSDVAQIAATLLLTEQVEEIKIEQWKHQ